MLLEICSTEPLIEGAKPFCIIGELMLLLAVAPIWAAFWRSAVADMWADPPRGGGLLPSWR